MDVVDGIDERAVSRWLDPDLPPDRRDGSEVNWSFVPFADGKVNQTLLATRRPRAAVAEGTPADPAPSDADTVVLKIAGDRGLTFLESPTAEADILSYLHRHGAPVPRVLAVDGSGGVLGRPAFAMSLLPGRAVSDDGLLSYHSDGWFSEGAPELRSELFVAFHDGLTRVHLIDPAGLGATTSHLDHLAYWQRSLDGVSTPSASPRLYRCLDRLRELTPDRVDRDPSICMGDARIANAIFDGGRLSGLIDWELGYVGNPAADIGYSVFTTAFFAEMAGSPLAGVPGADTVWDAWEDRTGRTGTDRAYWTAHGAMVLTVTAHRAIAAMLQDASDPGSSAAPEPMDEAMNPLVDILERYIGEPA